MKAAVGGADRGTFGAAPDVVSSSPSAASSLRGDRPVTQADVTKTRRAQWLMVIAIGGFILTSVAAGYALLYPRIANDLRKEWQEDDAKQSKAVVDAVAREFNFIREQLVEIRSTAKETRSELSGKIDRLTERVK